MREPEPTPETRFDRVFAELTIFERILLFLRGILTGKDRVALVEEFALKRIVKSLLTRASEYLNPRSMELLEPFSQEIADLRDAAEVFRNRCARRLAHTRRTL